MKRMALIVALTMSSVSLAVWLPAAKYGEQYTLYFEVYDSNSPWRAYETAPAAADVHVFQDGASEARATNAVTDLGRSFSLVLTAAEMTGKVITVDVNDASAPPLFGDAVFFIPTHGNASAYWLTNMDDEAIDATTYLARIKALLPGGAAGAVDPNSMTDAAWANLIDFVDGTGYAGGTIKLQVDVNDVSTIVDAIFADANWVALPDVNDMGDEVTDRLAAIGLTEPNVLTILAMDTKLGTPNVDLATDIAAIPTSDPNDIWNEPWADHNTAGTFGWLANKVWKKIQSLL